jgi:DAACS family dicarboxylate/amino acid:cation (Na+ or H+) symporter
MAAALALAMPARWMQSSEPAFVDFSIAASAWISGLYLSLVHLLALPLVFTGLSSSIGQLFGSGALWRTTFRAAIFAITTALLGIVAALSAAHFFRPGEAVSGEAAEGLIRMGRSATAQVATELRAQLSILDWLGALIPQDFAFSGTGSLLLPMLILAIVAGLALGLAERRKRGTGEATARLEHVYRSFLAISARILRFSPIPIGCLLFHLVMTTSMEPFRSLFPYIGVLLLAFTLQLTVIYFAAVWIVAGITPPRFFSAIREAMAVAFGTSSSSAAVAIALHSAHERLNVPEPVSRFVLTAGTCLNQCGSAMFLGVSVIFLAQFFGISLSLWQHSIVILSCGIAALGTVGLPGASLGVIALTLSMIGVPIETIGLLLGVDRLMDMCRSMLNVTGDLAMAVVITAADREMGDPPA